MGHHSTGFPFDQNSEEQIRKMMEDLGLQKQETKSPIDELGPLGTFPDGKIASNDEGAIAIGITTLHGRIVIDFGKPIHCIGFSKDEAVNLANLLFERARTL